MTQKTKVWSSLSGWLSWRNRTDASSAFAGFPEGYLSLSGIPIGPERVFTPPADKIDAYSSFDENDHENIKRISGVKLLYKGIPISKYLDIWQFHPGRLGGHLATARLSQQLIRAAATISRCCVELPNGGLALYYPKTMPTARFQTNEYIYSGIAQGKLLAGYTRLIRDDLDSERNRRWRRIARKLVKSMQFPFEDGGVCVDGKIILEAPNFRSCPEVILNGWIDALLHLYDYLQIVPSAELNEFYHKNVEALIDLLPDFDDPGRGLSRYSDLCPYSFRINFDGQMNRSTTPPRVTVEYLPTRAGYSGFQIADLWNPHDSKICAYDNRIENCRPSLMNISLSASSLYDIRIHVGARCSSLSFDPGRINAKSTVPSGSGQWRTVVPISKFDGRATTFVIRPAEQNLITGCPTNFVKNGKNFYHSYHVVSLYELALTTRSVEQKRTLTDFATRWLGYITKHQAGISGFVDPALFPKMISRFRTAGSHQTFDELRQAAAQGS